MRQVVDLILGVNAAFPPRQLLCEKRMAVCEQRHQIRGGATEQQWQKPDWLARGFKGEYNVTVREFPTNLTAKMFDYSVKPNFTVQNEAAIAAPPPVSFDTNTPSNPAPAGPEANPPPAKPAN